MVANHCVRLPQIVGCLSQSFRLIRCCRPGTLNETTATADRANRACTPSERCVPFMPRARSSGSHCQPGGLFSIFRKPLATVQPQESLVV